MQLQSRFVALALVMGLGLFASHSRRANALGPLPPAPSPTPVSVPLSNRTPQPTPPQPPIPSPTVPTVPPSNPEGAIPVVISYGQGLETSVQITRGLMEPVGIPFDRPVTVTLFLGSGVPGTPVRIGLYDGGQIASVVAGLPNPPPNIVTDSLNNIVSITVRADQTVQFNFQSGRTLGLYRTLVTVGPKQYLLQFYAVQPRATPPLPGVTPTPPPHETPPPS
jgi:hypothetical protein